uniref:Intraflagellar transport 22 homolog (Chlamydomonas) n=1 Tax=Cyprinus carpio TaxID=7962 RepID=A0A8C1TGR9_CYPCA
MFEMKILLIEPSEVNRLIVYRIPFHEPDIKLYVHRFESCWPALMKDASGVVIVFNPDVPSHLKEVETWHSTFISSQGLQDTQCLLIAHHKPGSGAGTTRPTLAPQLNKLPLIHSILEEEPEDVRQEFHKYLGNVMRMLSENQEREEMSIIT